jgi:hypothetical protein
MSHKADSVNQEANETWNTCPECGHEWADDAPTPGLLHRTRLCETCVDFDLRDEG